MKTERILVINPNSSTRVTEAIGNALEPMRLRVPFRIDVINILEAPPGITRQSDADIVTPLVQNVIATHQAAAYAVACFSDPGVAGAREDVQTRPVRGIGESAILHAMTRGDLFGIIALSHLSVLRQRRLVRNIAVADRYVGSEPIETTAEGATDSGLLDRMAEAAKKLTSRGADVIILGCAGMAHFQSELERRCSRPVIEPTRAAVALLIGDLLLSPREN